MWAELLRGLFHIEAAIRRIDMMIGFDGDDSDELPISSFRFVPAGLQPTDRPAK